MQGSCITPLRLHNLLFTSSIMFTSRDVTYYRHSTTSSVTSPSCGSTTSTKPSTTSSRARARPTLREMLPNPRHKFRHKTSACSRAPIRDPGLYMSVISADLLKYKHRECTKYIMVLHDVRRKCFFSTGISKDTTSIFNLSFVSTKYT